MAVEAGIFVDEGIALEGGTVDVGTLEGAALEGETVEEGTLEWVVLEGRVSVVLFVSSVLVFSVAGIVAFVVSWEWMPVFGVLSVQLTMDTHKASIIRKEKSDLNNECVMSISPILKILYTNKSTLGFFCNSDIC